MSRHLDDDRWAVVVKNKKFFDLPQEQQDFRLREEAMMIVAHMEYTPLSSLNIFELADQIIDYIKNGRKV